MTNEEFQAVFSYLTRYHEHEQSQDWYLPYGVLAGLPSRWTGGLSLARRIGGDTNGIPRNFYAHLPEFAEPDNIGSPKPDWSVLVAHVEPAMLAILRPRFLREIRVECRRRIMAVYGEGFFDDEVALRLRNGHTPAQDGERDRLRARYRGIKQQIEAADYETIKAFSLTDDALWEEPSE